MTQDIQNMININPYQYGIVYCTIGFVTLVKFFKQT